MTTFSSTFKMPLLEVVMWWHRPIPYSFFFTRRSTGGGGGAGAQARSQGGGRSPPPKCQKKGGNKVACMHVKLPPCNHFQSKIKYKFVLYVENTGHMHQIAPLTTSKCKKLSLREGGPLPHPPPPPLARSARSGSDASLPRTLFFTAPLKLNPGYATGGAPH